MTGRNVGDRVVCSVCLQEVLVSAEGLRFDLHVTNHLRVKDICEQSVGDLFGWGCPHV